MAQTYWLPQISLLRYTEVLAIPVSGIAEAVCSMTSNLLGQRRKDQLTVLLRHSIILSYGMTLPALAALLLYVEPVLFLFTSDTELIALPLASIPVMMLAMLLLIPGEILLATMAGSGDTPSILFIQSIVAVFMLIFTAVAAFALQLPLAYIWLAEVSGWTLCLGMCVFWLRRRAWDKLDI